jgi:hypothetical protein
MASFAMYMQHKQRTLFPLSHVTFSANFLAASEVDQIHSRKKEVLSCSQDFIFGGWSSQTVQRRDVLPALRTGITISKCERPTSTRYAKVFNVIVTNGLQRAYQTRGGKKENEAKKKRLPLLAGLSHTHHLPPHDPHFHMHSGPLVSCASDQALGLPLSDH